jgi:ribonuclease HII
MRSQWASAIPLKALEKAGIFFAALDWACIAFKEGAMPPNASSPKPTRRPDLALERKYGGLIAGIDEAGRGPWAGPVVAAAVIFTAKPPAGIHDSKQLTAEVRAALFPKIQAAALIGIGIMEVEAIDELNIYHATHAAMCEAVENLPAAPSAVLVDGNRLPKFAMPAEALVGGDALSISIAAASIIAKVTRDRIMHGLSGTFPAYGWERNKGYGTQEHATALKRFGVTCHHRRSFRPVWERALLEDGGLSMDGL